MVKYAIKSQKIDLNIVAPDLTKQLADNAWRASQTLALNCPELPLDATFYQRLELELHSELEQPIYSSNKDPSVLKTDVGLTEFNTSEYRL